MIMARILALVTSGTVLALILVSVALGKGVPFTPILARSPQPFVSVSEATPPNPTTIGAPASPELALPVAPDPTPRACPIVSPIDCATGALSIQFTDISIPGRGVGLSFARTYSSDSAHSNGPLGYGWTDNYQVSASSVGGAVKIRQGNGASLTFMSDGSGGFRAPLGSFASLVGSTANGYTLTLDQGKERLTFSGSGRLLSETDYDGNTTKLRYSGTRLVAITDPAGRVLSFTYSGGHITTVTDPMGRAESFTYDGSSDLVSASDSLGRAWRFAYTDTHLLRQVTDPRGGVTATSW